MTRDDTYADTICPACGEALSEMEIDTLYEYDMDAFYNICLLCEHTWRTDRDPSYGDSYDAD